MCLITRIIIQSPHPSTAPQRRKENPNQMLNRPIDNIPFMVVFAQPQHRTRVAANLLP